MARTKKDVKVEIVFDESKGKARARPINLDGWVRFPNNLRVVGAVYLVEELVEGKAGSWIAKGQIRKVA